MKKALLIKLEAPNIYSSIGMEAAFRQYYEVQSIDWQRIKFNHGLDGADVLWEIIMKTCESFRPDIIFCQFQKGDVLTLDRWIKLAKYGFVINYTEDVREDKRWYESVAPHIGLTIFTNEDDVKDFKCNNAGYMLVGYNHLWYKPQPKTDKYYGDIVFIGNNYTTSNLNFPYAAQRQEMIAYMKQKFGDKFQAYGLGQENQILNASQCVEAYNNAKIVITHNHFKRAGYCSDRGLNAMGCGAVVIHEYFEGIETLFEGIPYLYTWRTIEELADKSKGILNFYDEYKFDKIKISEYTKINHSWLNRVKFVIGMVKFKLEESI